MDLFAHNYFGSLRTRLTLLVVLALIPLIGLTAYSNWQARAQAKAEAQEEALRLVRIAVSEQEALIQTTRQLLFSIAQWPEAMRADPQACRAHFDSLLAEYPVYSGLTVSSADGRVTCSAPDEVGGVRFSDRSWFREVLAIEDFVVSDYRFGRLGGESVVVVAYPILSDSGVLDGVVSAGLDMAWLGMLIDQAGIPAEYAYTVIDRNGIILARSPDPAAWVGRPVAENHVTGTVLAAEGEGVLEDVGIDGVSRLYAYAPLETANEPSGFIFIGIPDQTAYLEANRSLLVSSLVLFVVTGSALLGARYAGNRLILRPVSALNRAVQQLGGGDFSARTGLDYRTDEIGGLARSFDLMAAALEAKEAEVRQGADQIARQLANIKALRRIDLAITGGVQINRILEIVLEGVMTTLDADASCVLLLGEEVAALEFVAGSGFDTSALERRTWGLEDTHGGLAVTELRAVQIPDMAECRSSGRLATLGSQNGMVACTAVPIVNKGSVEGVLEVYHRTRFQPDNDWLGDLEAFATQGAIAIDNAHLWQNLQQANDDLVRAYDTTLEGWSHALDLRDRETEGHSRRVMEVTLKLARAMAIDESRIQHIRRGAMLHDIGKMGISDAILLKPGALSESEWAIMRRHPTIAMELLLPIDYLRASIDIPYCHHERWDGTGYPRGLSGEAIPLSARIFMVGDVWDALRSDRPYRGAWSRELALQYIRGSAGSHFDPQVVRTFLQLIDRGEI